MKTIYLVRHAQSLPAADVDTRDWPLSPVGQAQTRRLAAALGRLGIEEVHSSPYRRCVDTVRDFAAAARVPLRIDHALRERRFAPGVIDDFPDLLARSWADFSFALPGCESSAAARDRMLGALVRIAQGSRATILAITSHGAALSLVLHALDPGFGLEQATAMRTPEVYQLLATGGDLRRDPTFHLAELDEFATQFDQTRFPLSGTRALAGP